jgi:hypothetical protein
LSGKLPEPAASLAVKALRLFFTKHSPLFQFFLAFLVILGLIFIVQVGVSPGVSSMSTDSGVFAYCGQQILHGGLLYRDCWDNKPPAVYYLNAIAVALGGSTPGSLWFFQAAWIVLTGAAFYLVLQKIFKSPLVIFITFFFLANVLYPPYYEGGNLTETYVLLPVILLMGMFFNYLSTGKKSFLVAIGLLAAFAFLLKPTYIAVSLAVALTVLYLDAARRSLHSLLVDAAFLALSFLLPLLLVASYWAIQGSFNDFWFAIFKHNLQYTQEGFTRQSLVLSFQLYFTLKPMAVVVSLALISGVVFLYDHWRKILPWRMRGAEVKPQDFTPKQMGEEGAQRWFLFSLLLSIPLDFVFFALSGKNFGHYLLVPLPALTSLCLYSLIVLSLFQQRKSNQKSVSIEKSVFVIALAALVLFYVNWFSKVAGEEFPEPARLAAFLKQPNVFTHQVTELEQYVLDHSQPDETVLTWSSDPYLNFITGRRSPTRYVFPLHLLTPTLTDSQGFDELIGALQENPPAVIAAQPNPASGMPFFEGNGDVFCPNCTEEASAGLLRLKTYLENHYRFDRQIWDWYLYLPLR